jgi:hypothetical protein
LSHSFLPAAPNGKSLPRALPSGAICSPFYRVFRSLSQLIAALSHFFAANFFKMHRSTRPLQPRLGP